MKIKTKPGNQAAVNQYPALNGLLMRKAKGEMSTNLSVGIFSPPSVNSMPLGLVLATPSLSMAIAGARATEKE